MIMSLVDNKSHDHVFETNFSPHVPLAPPFFPLPLCAQQPPFQQRQVSLDVRGWSRLHTSPAPTVCFYFPPLFYYFTNCFILLDYVYERQRRLHCCKCSGCHLACAPTASMTMDRADGGDQHKELETSASPAPTVCFLFIYYFTFTDHFVLLDYVY